MEHVFDRRAYAVWGVVIGSLGVFSCGGGGGDGGGATTTTEIPISQLSSGGASNCRISSGTSATVCWGQNDAGQLGIGNTTDTATPAAVSFPGGKTAKKIVHGVEHACAILNDDTVACWGDNSAGQLGQDSTTVPQSTNPVLVPGLSGVKVITAGLAHTCIIAANSTVQCWGSNAKGQLGQVTAGLVQTHLPQTIGGVTASALVSGYNHLCAKSSISGAVVCWGDNQYGQLGNGGNTDSSTPVAADSLASVVALTAGAYHSCAATAAKTYCWGHNDAGQLGLNGTIDLNVPTETQSPLAGATQLVAGLSHTCALTASSAECWGSNTNKQLSGNTSGGNARVTVPLTAPPPAKALSAGLGHTCAQDANNATWCWGAGSMGRLGPNASSDAATPVQVVP